MKTIAAIVVAVVCLLGMSQLSLAQSTIQQQLIGEFPDMDGGFEGQPVGNMPTGTITGGAQQERWTTRYPSHPDHGTISNASPRTGAKMGTFFCGDTLRDRLQTPTAAANAVLDATYYTIQYYYRTAGAVPPASYMRIAVSPSGTGGLSVFTGLNPAATSNAWLLYRDTVKSSTVAGTTKYGVGSVGHRDTAMTASMDIDDFVIYAGLPDATAPDAPTAPLVSSTTSSQIGLSWTAPVTGIDSGGYLVVRKLGSDPSTVPNANGIYAKGNTVAAGEQVVYIGTNPSCTDDGLTPSSHYYYRIYTVDKAFNYSSTSIAIDASTSAPNYATEPTVPATDIGFTATSSSLTINWTSGNGSNRLVVVRDGSAVNSDPSDGATYAANSVFGSGYQLGIGNFVVYGGTGSSVTVTGLAKHTQYYVAIYEFNGSGGTENYLTSSVTTGNAFTLPGSVTSAQSGDWTVGSTWVGGVVPTASDDVTIASGHTVTVPSTQSVYNLSISAGAVLRSGVALPIVSTSIRYLRVNGSSLVTDGTLGGASDAIGVECWASVTFTGSGILSPCRIRPASNHSDLTITINQDATLTYTGSDGLGGTALYPENSNNDNINIVIGSGATVTFSDYASFYSNNLNSNANCTSTITVDGSVDLSGANSNLGIKTASGKACALAVNGAVTVGRNFNATSSTGGAVNTVAIGSGGSMTVRGLVDCTEPTLAITGAGSFTVDSGAVINIGSPDGLSATAATGSIQTGIRNFSPFAQYRYAGVEPQVTGDGLPSTISRLTVSDSAGLSLTTDVTITDTLHTSTGDLNLNGHTITLGPAGYLREPEGNSVYGTSGAITTTRVLTAPSDTVDIAGLGISIGSAADLGNTVITRGHAEQSPVASMHRYFDITPSTNTGLDATLKMKYTYAQLNGIPEEELALYRSIDGGTSWSYEGGSLDTAANLISIAGVGSFSRWTAAGYNAIVSLTKGWNLVSNPVTGTNDSLALVFPASINPYGFKYVPGVGYSQQYVMERGVGYWAKFAGDAVQYIPGLRQSEDTIAVSEGWNMVGSISYTVDTAAVVSDPPGLRASNWFGYTAGYSAVTSLTPGKAFWIKAKSAGSFILKKPALTAARKRPAENPLERLNVVTITDRNGQSQSLYFGAENPGSSSFALYSLPPAPPAGAFDARFETPDGGTMVRTFNAVSRTSVELPVAIRSDAYPVRVSWQICDPANRYAATDLSGKLFFGSRVLEGTGSMELSGTGASRIIITASALAEKPGAYSLSQNYPNPFNPTTRMDIALPVRSSVSLRVYNMLGQEISELATGVYDEGYHSFTWTGQATGGLPAGTGVYFMKFTARSLVDGKIFSQVRKMVLMK